MNLASADGSATIHTSWRREFVIRRGTGWGSRLRCSYYASTLPKAGEVLASRSGGYAFRFFARDLNPTRHTGRVVAYGVRVFHDDFDDTASSRVQVAA